MLFPLSINLHTPGEHLGCLFIKAVILQDSAGGTLKSKNVRAIIDTGAHRTAIPLDITKQLGFRQVGTIDAAGFDRSKGGESYPAFLVLLTVPRLMKKELRVIGCQRDDVLLGLDICQSLHLGACWKGGWFGLKHVFHPHDALHTFFNDRNSR